MEVRFVRALCACPFVLALATAPISVVADTQPLTLRRAVDAALARNPALATFEFELRAQDARTRQAAWRPAPEASLEVENVLGFGENEGTDAAEYTLALSRVVELGGKRDARIAASQAARSDIEVARQAEQLDVLAEVTRRFIAVAARQEEVGLARRAVELAEQTVEGSERRVQSAKSPHAELDRARIAVERAKLAQRAADAELDAARVQLAATWGETRALIDGTPLGEVEADLFALPEAGDFLPLVDRLRATPDFLRFASEARLRDTEVRLASTFRRPDVTLSGGVRRLEAGGDHALVGSVSLPLFSGRRAVSVVDEAQARRELVDAERRVAEVRVEAMLYELHRQLGRTVAEAATLREEILPRAEEALAETEYAYERGRFSYLELVDAQREYLAVQAALIDAAANAHGLRAEIERLTNAPLTTP